MGAVKVHTWLAGLAILLLATALNATPLHRRAGVVPSLSGDLHVMGPVGNSTYPRANFLADGSIIGTYTAFDDNSSGARESIITLARSTDSGATWTEIGTAARGPTATTDIDNPYVLQLPSGRVLVAFRNHDHLTDGVTYTYFRITVCYSDDDGASWSYLSTPAEDSGTVTGDWEPLLRIADDGETLQLFYSRENNDDDQDSLLRTSTTGGETWSDATTISGAELSNSRDGMLGVAETSTGDLIAVFETEKGGSTFHIEAVTSEDGGATWIDRRVVYQTEDTSLNAAAPQVINVGGTLVVSFQTNEDGDTAVKLVTSGDDGQTWDNKITAMPAVSQWAGLLTLDDSSFLVMAGNDGTAKAQKVILS
ncbi:hypothetical protein SLS57_004735 [Botryosphaeria dothidea]